MYWPLVAEYEPPDSLPAIQALALASEPDALEVYDEALVVEAAAVCDWVATCDDCWVLATWVVVDCCVCAVVVAEAVYPAVTWLARTHWFLPKSYHLLPFES